jgi:hypothetical protein
MTKQMSPISRSIGPAFCLAVAWVVFTGGIRPSQAEAESDSGRSGAVVAAPIKTVPSQDRQRLAEERAKVSAMTGKRDPFKVPPPQGSNGKGDDIDGPLPPGVRGLVIGQLRLKGIVREDASNTMIAVVTNRANLAYFLRVHEDVYNGVVSRITPDAVYFQQNRVDSNGRVDAREVVLKLDAERQEAR